MNNTRTSPAMSRIVAALLAFMVAIAGVVFVSSASNAATHGIGFDEGDGFLGSYVSSDGTRVFCIDAGNDDWYSGTYFSHYGKRSGSTYPPGVSEDQAYARANYLLTNYANTGDPVTAAAVAMLVWYFIDYSNASAHASPYSIVTYYSYRAGSNQPAVAAMYNALLAQANGVEPTYGGSGSGVLNFNVDSHNNYNGTVTMNGTAGAVGTITLTNGIFVSNGTNTLTGATAGTAYAVTGVVPEVGAPADPLGTPFVAGGTYKIWGTGHFTAGAGGYLPEVAVYATGSGGQWMATAGRNPTSEFDVTGQDPMFRATQFGPAVTTVATQFVEIGETFSDTITFTTAADDTGLNNPWFYSSVNGYVPVTANGTLYGPYLSPPAASGTVPSGAPVAGTASVTSSTADGPTVDYTATSDTVASESGYYTWVWSIDWNDQTPAAQYFIPGPSPVHPDQEPYYFQDSFAQVVETSIVASTITATSQVTASEVAFGAEITDSLTVGVSGGGWIQADGGRVPVTFRGTAYYVAENPTRQAGVPSDATPLGTTTLTVRAPGTYVSDPLVADVTVEGYIVWVWEILESDQPEAYRGLVNEWADDFGIPAETQAILRPVVTTQAQAGVNLGGEIFDVAEVGGVLPVDGAVLGFQLYQVPTVVDPETGIAYIDAPDGAEDLSWVCTPENLVYDAYKEGEEQYITLSGSYTSESFTPESHGMYLWVESLRMVESGVEIARGICGEPFETSYVIDVTTKASGSADVLNPVGMAMHDTAQVVGFVPEGATVTFEAYVTDAAQPTCTPDTLSFTSTPVELDGPALYSEEQPLEVTGESHVFNPDFDSKVYWVEVTRDGAGRIISQGECGEPDETAGQRGSKVIDSGGALPIAGLALALVLLAGGGTAALVIRRRRHI